VLAGRHSAGEEYRSGFAGESVRGRSRCPVACRGGMLRELAQVTGLSTQARAALADTYRGHWIYEPGAVFADLVAAVADRATVSTGSERAALIASMFSALPPPRPRRAAGRCADRLGPP
jgi:hypothetical protein